MEVNEGERSRGEALGKGRMDYSAQVVTSPDSTLYSRELSNACPHPVTLDTFPGNLAWDFLKPLV